MGLWRKTYDPDLVVQRCSWIVIFDKLISQLRTNMLWSVSRNKTENAQLNCDFSAVSSLQGDSTCVRTYIAINRKTTRGGKLSPGCTIGKYLDRIFQKNIPLSLQYHLRYDQIHYGQRLPNCFQGKPKRINRYNTPGTINIDLPHQPKRAQLHVVNYIYLRISNNLA